MGYGTYISQLNVRNIATTYSKYPQTGTPNGKKAAYLSQVTSRSDPKVQ